MNFFPAYCICPRPSMSTFSAEVTTLNSSSLLHRAAGTATLQRHVHALVISPNLEARKRLLQVLENLSADVISCSTKAQADGVLYHQCFEIVFCDEQLPDGSYADLIHADHFEHRIPRIVVVTRIGEWELYFEATSKGAFDVIRAPWHPTDIEMTVIRALHEEEAKQAVA
jgi:DNA-binding NtrC family response regulator